MTARQLTARPVAPPARRELRWAYGLALAAIVLQMALPSNLLFFLGVNYAAPPQGDGQLLAKFHPATFLIVLAAIIAWIEASGTDAAPPAVCRRALGIPALLVMMAATAGYAVVSVGVSGSSIYAENFAAAGLLALVVEGCTPARRRHFAQAVALLALLSAPIVVAENALQTHFVPYYVDGMAMRDLPGQFRGAALFDHPLTGASVTMMAIFLVAFTWRAGLARIGALVLLVLAMVAYGGRTALAVTILALACMLVWQAWCGLVRGHGAMRPLLLLAGGALAGTVLIGGLIAFTDIGERLANTFYLDDSAAIRSVQWQVLGLLNLRQMLFGVQLADQSQLTFSIGLAYAFADIENFWLLIFISLGAVGFTLFLLGLLPFLAHLWRLSAGWGRMLLLGALVVASSSNSLGRKSNLLFVLTAALVGAAATETGPAPVPVPAAPPRVMPRASIPAGPRRLRPI